jgi:hypothetical protein
MAALYRAGQTLEQIGTQYGVTRERVRQIIAKHHGLNAKSGGAHILGIEAKRKRAVERDARYLAQYGCTWDQYREVRAIGRAMVKAGSKFGRTPLGAYLLQRRNAHERGIRWEFNFWQWWSVWQASGHWEQRGRGQGYCMCRKGDAGPYALGNVYIAPSRENSSARRQKTSGLPMGVSKHRNRFHAQRSIYGSIKRLGSFLTPEEAHAAYLAADPALGESIAV